MIDKNKVIELLDEVYDPELGLKITDLGLVYRIDVQDDGIVDIDFTLTYPGCPAADFIYSDIQEKVIRHPDVKDMNLNIVWDPPWSPEKMSEEARLNLGYPI
jgi:metal-sulfur cluster biosynthetic enzyme